MKTLRLTSLIFALGLLVANLAFADNLYDGNKNNECKTADCKSVAIADSKADDVAAKETKTPLVLEEVEDEPVFDAAAVTSMIKEREKELISVKVFDGQGNLVDEETVSMHELMSTNFAANKLPANSAFLMYFDNTAYYIID